MQNYLWKCLFWEAASLLLSGQWGSHPPPKHECKDPLPWLPNVLYVLSIKGKKGREGRYEEKKSWWRMNWNKESREIGMPDGMVNGGGVCGVGSSIAMVSDPKTQKEKWMNEIFWDLKDGSHCRESFPGIWIDLTLIWPCLPFKSPESCSHQIFFSILFSSISLISNLSIFHNQE